MKTFVFLMAVSVFLTSSLLARTIRVPEDFAKIQDAVNEAANGDTVLVAPGVYSESIRLEGKNIVLASHYILNQESAYIKATLLQLSGNGTIIQCENITSRAVITGFTIGAPHFECNGIECQSASPLICNNIFSDIYKSGIRCLGNSEPVIRNNTFQFYSHGTVPQAIIAFEGYVQILNNTFQNNNSFFVKAIYINNSASALISGNRIDSFYSGISNYGYQTQIVNNLITHCYYAIETTRAQIQNNTIADNIYGISSIWSAPEITNCILWNNQTDFNGDFIISHSCMRDCLPWNAIDKGGNIFRDPQFVDAQNGDYHLKGYSPCIDAGIAQAEDSIPAYDLDGNLRIQDGTGEGQAVIDMGCYERPQAVNPAFVSGRITLNGGNANVEEAWVGIGTMVHPDADGNYEFAISAPDSQYTVIATLDSYLTQRIENVTIRAGSTTPNVDFTLDYYHPDTLLTVRPDTLKFLTWDEANQQSFWLKNISLTDVCLRWARTNEYGSFFYVNQDSFPRRIAPGDSISLTVYTRMLTKNHLSKTAETDIDSLTIYFNEDSLVIPILYDPDLFDAIDEKQPVARSFELLQNYPNPFNARTTIRFSLAQKGPIELAIYNISGQKIRTLFNGESNAGAHSVIWNGKNDRGQDVPSGLYIGLLKSGRTKQMIKMIMLK